MYIEALRIRNFRRLRDVKIDLVSDISIFVGANNSGKTSAAHAIQLFTSNSRERFSIHDFSVDSWAMIDGFGDEQPGVALPAISLDIWFNVSPPDLHRVVDLLPNLSWEGSRVGIRIEFAASDPGGLLANFGEARDRARANIRPGVDGVPDFHPSPRTLREYLSDNHGEKLRREFELRYYVLDPTQFDDDLQPPDEYEPLQLTPDKGRGGKEILNSLLRVDFLHAQRHLSDAAGGGRAEDLSRCLSRFYERNLEKRGDDYDIVRALADSEAMLNDHLQRVFEPTLGQLGALGYPGLTNPRLLIKSALNPATIMSSHDGARVHYAFEDPQGGMEPLTLPDRYSGLGYKNLIYMVVELLDLHSQWMDVEEDRPPLHLIFIEEPEAHLHAQLQQVFIRKVLDILAIQGEDQVHYSTQLTITTHSPHILYERGFRPVRYFRRSSGLEQISEVLNLSAFYEETENPTRDFLARYLKLTHCDLFFADAAVLVEGNVERLLLPQMIAKAAPQLQSAYLSILEIGGAFGHRFRTLIEYLGITTLIVTDIDSVHGPAGDGDNFGADDEPDEMEDDGEVAGSACMVHREGAVTSNQTLVHWLPGLRSIADLLAATPEERTQNRPENGGDLVRVVYQCEVEAAWRGEVARVTGRTLEEAFAIDNLTWSQDADRADLKLRVRGKERLTVVQMAERLHIRIKGSGFNKTDFALALLAQDPDAWVVPQYIIEGLHWLEREIAPPPPAVPAQAIRGDAA